MVFDRGGTLWFRAPDAEAGLIVARASCACLHGRDARATLMDITNRRVLITGASRGLGRTLAFAFAAAGAREVFTGARKPEDIEKLKRDAAAMGAPITPIKLDVTS